MQDHQEKVHVAVRSVIFNRRVGNNIALSSRENESTCKEITEAPEVVERYCV